MANRSYQNRNFLHDRKQHESQRDTDWRSRSQNEGVHSMEEARSFSDRSRPSYHPDEMSADERMRWDSYMGSDYQQGFPRDYAFDRDQGYGNYGSSFGRDRYYDQSHSAFGQENRSMREPSFARGRGPKGYTRSDERIREDVCDRLGNGQLDASEVEVSVAQGEVTLTGTVPDRQTKYQIEELSDRVGGVKDVHNQLTIQRADRTQDQDRKQLGKQESKQEESNSKRGSSSPSISH